MAKAAILSAVPPLMVKTAANPGGLPKEVFDGLPSQLAANRSQFCYDFAGRTVLWLQPAWCESLAGGDLEWVAARHDGYDGIVTDFTEALKKIRVPCAGAGDAW